jgi:hypothetical protein
MTLTKRGKVVAIIGVLGLMLVIGRVEADVECATFQANNDYKNAHAAGCSFDALPNGEYPYTWKAN